MSANDDLRSQAVSHALHKLGYSNALNRQIEEYLSGLQERVTGEIGAELAKSYTGGKPASARAKARMDQTLDEVNNLVTNVYSKSHDYLKGELTEFAKSEAQFSTKSVNKAVKANLATVLPASARLKAIVTEDPINGEHLKSTAERLGATLSGKISTEVRDGMARGMTIDKIVARVVGTEGFEGSRANARTIVRTVVNHVSNRAQIETFRANRDIIHGWQFVATLDSRTTLLCANQDGRVYDLDDVAAMPPLHRNCRSAITAITKPLEEYRGKQKLSGATRASMDGQIPAATTFETFLRGKSEEFQNEIFKSKVRADLWRRGKLNLNDFVRNYSEVIPLDDLRRLHPEAFADEATEAAQAAQKTSQAVEKAKPVPTHPKALVDAPEAPNVDKLDAASRDRILAAGRKSGVEHLEAFDTKTGKMIQDNAGTVDQVVFTDALVKAIQDSRNEINLHHNHPSSSSFSYQDLKMLTEYRGMKTIYAHGNNGSLFRAERGARVLKKNIVDAVGDAIRRGLQVMINRGTLQPAEAAIMYNHLIWVRIGELDYLKYTYEFEGQSKAIYEAHREAFEQILETTR